MIAGVATLLRGISSRAKAEDGKVVEDGELNMLGEFWRNSLGEFTLADFGHWRKALESGRVETPDWFPPVRDICKQLSLARDQYRIDHPDEPADTSLPKLTHEQGYDHLRARTTGADPAYGPMKDEWIKRSDETSEDYAERMFEECEKILPGVAPLRAIRDKRRQAKGAK